MIRIFWRAAYWLAVAALIIIGGRNIADPSSTLEQRWREVMVPWLQANWIALGCFVLAAVLMVGPVIIWVMERRFKAHLQREIRTSLTPSSFRETDAAKALNYLLSESVWGWKAYARMNHWTMVDGLHLQEFARAAASGDILTIGYGSRENGVAIIERRYWITGRIEDATAKTQGGVVMVAGSRHQRITYAQLAIATADLEQTWPRATVARRAWAKAWVWFKTQWYGYGPRALSERWHRRQERRRAGLK